MIYRILTYSLFGCLVIALLLSFAGVTEVYMGDGFTHWLRVVNSTFESWRFEIPRVPEIPLLKTTSEQSSSSLVPDWDLNGDGTMSLGEFFAGLEKGSFNNKVINALKNLGNALITFFNFLIRIINILVVVINIAIQVIRFILTMVWCIKDIPQYLVENEWIRYGGSESIWWWQNVGNLIFNG